MTLGFTSGSLANDDLFRQILTFSVQKKALFWSPGNYEISKSFIHVDHSGPLEILL